MMKKIFQIAILIVFVGSCAGCSLLGTALSAAAGYAIYQASHK